jgi:hypothetical protein
MFNFLQHCAESTCLPTPMQAFQCIQTYSQSLILLCVDELLKVLPEQDTQSTELTNMLTLLGQLLNNIGPFQFNLMVTTLDTGLVKDLVPHLADQLIGCHFPHYPWRILIHCSPTSGPTCI